MDEESMYDENTNEESIEDTLERLADHLADMLELKETSGMNDQEFRTMSHLTGAWDHFLQIPDMRDDDREDFLRALHAAQNIIGMSVLRRDRPEFWVGKKE